MSRSSGDRMGRHVLRLILQNELFSITGHVNFGLIERHWSSSLSDPLEQELPTLSPGAGNSSSFWNVSFMKYQRQMENQEILSGNMATFTSLCPTEPRTLLITRLQKYTDALHSTYVIQKYTDALHSTYVIQKYTDALHSTYVVQNDGQKWRPEISEAEHRLQNPSLIDKILRKEQDSEEYVIPGHSTLSFA